MSCELIKIGTPEPRVPAHELRLLGLLLRDLKACRETEDFLRIQGLMGEPGKERELVQNGAHAGYRSISKFASLQRESLKTLQAFVNNSNFADAKEAFTRFLGDQVRYWENQVESLVGLVQSGEEAALKLEQDKLRATAGGGVDGLPWHANLPEG
eukprot:8566077-Pyramimonas_sp.AAC.1